MTGQERGKGSGVCKKGSNRGHLLGVLGGHPTNSLDRSSGREGTTCTALIIGAKQAIVGGTTRYH